MKIAHRIGLGFAAIVAMAVLVGGIGIACLSAIAEQLVEIKQTRVPNVQQVAVIADNLNQAAQVLRNALIFEEPAKVADMLKLSQQKIDLIDEATVKLMASVHSDEGKRLLAAVAASREAFVPAKQQFVALLDAGRKAEATTLLVQKMRPDQMAYKKAIDELYDHELAYVMRTANDGEASYHQARTLMLGLLGLMAGLATWVAWVSARAVSVPLGQAVKVAERVAAGDLSSVLVVKTDNEVGMLFGAMKKMNDSLVQIVGQVRSSVIVRPLPATINRSRA